MLLHPHGESGPISIATLKSNLKISRVVATRAAILPIKFEFENVLSKICASVLTRTTNAVIQRLPLKSVSDNVVNVMLMALGKFLKNVFNFRINF